MNGKIQLTCDNEYELYVNGEIFGSSNHWKNKKEYHFQIKNGENTILVKCKNRWGAAGLVANIFYLYNGQNNLIVTNESWEVSEDKINWYPASIIGDYGKSPWKRPLNLDDSTKWIWFSKITNNQTIWARKIIVCTKDTKDSKTIENKQQNKTKTENPKQETSIDTNFKDTWNRVITEATQKIEKISDEETTLKKFENFITPHHPDIIQKAKELNNDPKKCYNFVASNIKYISDDTNYGQSEFWTYPHETLAKGSGDCEDQAFLIASMLTHLNIECVVRTAYLLEYNSGHAWCYFKWNNEWLAAECTSDSFDPWDKAKRPQYGPYLPWIDIQLNKSYNYTGLDMIKQALRIQAKDYSDGTIRIK